MKKKILSLNPASEIFSSKPEPIESAEQDDEVTKDYNAWLNEYHPERKSKNKSNLPIREKKLINIDEKPKPPEPSSSSKKIKNSDKTKRISGYDFRSWDKFDVDKACQEVDKISSCSDEKVSKAQELLEDSLKFKESGNRFFQQKNYIKAIEMYSKSLENDPENWAALNNRALCHMKLDDFSLGVDDTSRIIANDKSNVKALLRRAKCYNSLKKYEEAKDDLIQVQIADKKNGRKTGNDVIEMLKMVEKNLAPTYKKRMVIEDDSDSDSDIKKTNDSASGKKKTIQTPEKNNMKRNDSISQKHKPTTTYQPWAKKPTPKVEIKKKDSITQIDKLKQTADDAYRCGDYSKAENSYQACIVKVSQIEALDEKSIVQLVNLHNNLAICNIKLGQHSKAIKQTNIILNELDESNEKARLRRGHCYEQIDCYLPAWHDYRAVLNKYSTSATARAGIDRVTNILKDKFGNDYRQKLDEYLERQRAKSPRNSQSDSVKAEPLCEFSQEKSKEQNDFETCQKSDSKHKSPCVLETTEVIVKSEDNLDLKIKKLDATVGDKLKKLSLSDVKPVSTVSTTTHQKISLVDGQNSDQSESPPNQPSETLFNHKLTSINFLTEFSAKNSDRQNWNILSQVSPPQLPNLISTNLDGDILFLIIKLIDKFVLPHSLSIATALLSNLTLVSRFSMCLDFLDEDEQKFVHSVISKMNTLLQSSNQKVPTSFNAYEI